MDTTVVRSIRKVTNLQCSSGPQELGYGVKLVPVPDDFDLKWPSTHQWKAQWMVEAKPTNLDDFMRDGSFERALRFLPTAMYLTISPHLRFDVEVYLNSKDEICTIKWDESFYPYQFFLDLIDLADAKVDELRQTLDLIIQYQNLPPILDVPLRRFVRACNAKNTRPNDAIIDTYVAFECLYMSDNKEDIACISASFVATDSATREKAFIDLYGLGLTRNKILHQGIDRPVITFKNGIEMNTEELRELGLSYLATILKKILSDTNLLSNEKRTIVEILKRRAEPLRDEFENYKKQYITEIAR